MKSFKRRENILRGRFASFLLIALLFLCPALHSDASAAFDFNGSDTTGLHKLIDLEYLKKIPFDSALNILKKSSVIAKKRNDKLLLSKIYMLRGRLFYKKGNFENALVNYKWAYDILKNNYDDSELFLKDIHYMSSCYYYLNMPDSLLFYSKIGLQKSSESGNAVYQAKFYNNIGDYYDYTNYTAKALEYYLKSLETIKKTGNLFETAREKISIGIVYYQTDELDKAKRYYFEALEIGKKLNDPDIMSAVNSNLGAVYFKEQKFDSANYFMEKSLEMDILKNDMFNYTASLINLGAVEIDINNKDKAFERFKKAMKIAAQNNYSELQTLAYINLGSMFNDSTYKKHNIDSALKYYEKALSLSKKRQKQDDIYTTLNVLQNLYAKKGDYKKAYEMALEFQKTSDSIFNKEKNKQLLEIKTKHETEKKEKELIIARQKVDRIRLIAIIIVLSLLVALGIMFFMLRIRFLNNKKLRERQQFVDSLLENASSYVCVVAKDGNVTYKSPTFFRDFADLKHKDDFFSFIHPDDVNKMSETLKKVVAETLQKIQFECRVKNNNGKYRYIIGVISNKINNKILNGYLINFWDITRQKEYENAIIESERKYKTIFEAFPDIYFNYDKNGIITEVSPSVEKISGYKPSEAIGKNILIFYKNREDFQKVQEKLMAEKEINDYSVYFINKNGDSFIASLTAKMNFDEKGNIIDVIGVVRDITDRVKQEEELKEASETKDKLFSIIAHDLVGPIGMQKNMIDLLVSDINEMSKEEIVPFVESMKPALDATFFMIENLLSWARIMHKSIKPFMQKSNIFEIVNRIFEFLNFQASKKNIKLEYQGDKELYAVFDKNMIEIVLRNLITNAIKFSLKGSSVTVSATPDNKKVKISIIDRGIGMSKDILENLNKEKHTSVSKIGTENEKGTGIGLIVAKEFIALHKSRLKIESEEGKGSIFSFYLDAE